jgi:DNA polymerase-3 subunit delta
MANSITSVAQLEQSLERGEIAPLYLFHGEEEFLMAQAVRLVAEAALEEGARGFNLDTVDGAEGDGKDVAALAASYPMSGERRVVVVRDVEKLSNLERLLPAAEKPSPTACLVLTSSKPDFRLKFFREVRENGVVLECRRLYENELPDWVARRLKELGKAPTPEACQLIPMYVGRSLRELQSEVEKVAIYVGDKPSVDADDVNSVVGLSRQFNIFELQKAVGLKNLARSMEIMERMLVGGESAVGMIVMLTRYFQKVWVLQELVSKRIPEAQIPPRMGVHPFAFREYLAASKNYPGNALRDCFSALLEADETLKSSPLDERLTMTMLIFRLAGTFEPVGKLEG